MKWIYDVDINGGAYVDLNKQIQSHKENAIKLFTDKELKEELRKRESNESKHKDYIGVLDTYMDNLTVSVDVFDVLNEVDNDDLLSEVEDRGLNIVKMVEPSTLQELKKFVCLGLGINEYYPDEEILEMLKEKWRLMI